jgi:P-type Cu2+ transporter
VVDGWSECDESILTGQPEPQPKAPGDPVHAGSLNGSGQLSVRASVRGDETRWIRISRLVREALGRKSLVGEAMDRASSYFLPFVLVLAAVTVWFWESREAFDQALLAGLSVLVVACPCALGLAVPLAAALGIGRAAQRGVLIRGTGVLERLGRLKGVAFDKTGTLTRGELRPIALTVDGSDEAGVLRFALALARGSAHPVARAVAVQAAGNGVQAGSAQGLRVHPGAGITGQIEGISCAIGSSAFMARLGWPVTPKLAPNTKQEDCSVVYVGWRGRVHGRIDLADGPRIEARQVVSALIARGLKVRLLSGDRPEPVARLAARLGISGWHAGLTPEAKAAMIGDWARVLGPVAMVGDGLNDGLVLAAAPLGIAVGRGTDLAKESADVVLPDDGLASLPWVLELARQVRRSIRVNLFWAFGYNAGALALAAAGLLQPVLAAALMAGSSLVVVIRTLNGQAARTVAAARPKPLDGQRTAVMPSTRKAVV